MAQGGTLFLDEIGELSLALPVKLLRFLQDRQIERVGGRESIAVDARVIAATNTDLKRAMTEGRFREDLYYRLGVVTIGVPPLRERTEDIALLAKTFLDRYTAETGKTIKGLTQQAQSAIQSYSWPGNIRELENRIKRAVIMAEGPRLTPGDLELAIPHPEYEGRRLKEASERLEKDLIQQSLIRHDGNLTRVAADLGISRPALYEMIEKLGIRKEKRKSVGS